MPPHLMPVSLVRVLFGDINKRNREIAWHLLKSTEPPIKLVGALALGTFADDMAIQETFPVPNTYGRARTLLK